MKRKLTLWGAVCLILVCLMQMTVMAAGNVTINQCIISGGNQVTVTATTVSNVASDDGNYYLLAFDDYAQDLRTYRVDRMKSVSFTKEPRDGEKVFLDIDLKSYTQRVFSMFGGEQQKVTIQFRNYLLDAVVDRFGTKGIQYFKVDDRHFKITAPVEISDQFFSWVCGFGSKAKITYPEKVVSEFKEYLDKIRDMY